MWWAHFEGAFGVSIIVVVIWKSFHIQHSLLHEWIPRHGQVPLQYFWVHLHDSFSNSWSPMQDSPPIRAHQCAPLVPITPPGSPPAICSPWEPSPFFFSLPLFLGTSYISGSPSSSCNSWSNYRSGNVFSALFMGSAPTLQPKDCGAPPPDVSTNGVGFSHQLQEWSPPSSLTTSTMVTAVGTAPVPTIPHVDFGSPK